jgi:hypothetical protein
MTGERTCGGYGPTPTSWIEVLDRDLGSLWDDDRETFEAWLAAVRQSDEDNPQSDE